MLLHNVLLKTIRDLRWPVFWTGLGLAVLGGYFMWIFPTFSKTLDFQSLLDKFPPGIKALIGGSMIDLSSPSGFLNVELFPLMLPLVLSAFAVGLASGATAGEEARGTLDLLLAEPVQRWRVLTEKAIALALATAVVAACLFVGIEVAVIALGLDLPTANVVAGILLAILLALGFGAITLALAALTGNRARSIGVMAALIIASYFVNALAPLVDVLNSIRGLSLFYYYIGNDPIRNGIDIGHALVLGAIALVAFGLALVAFERRDLAA